MKLKYLILISASIPLLFQCKSKEEKEPTNVTDFIPNIPSPDVSIPYAEYHAPANDIYGEWIYLSNNLFYNEELKIIEDGTFQFCNYSCFGKGYTTGTWLSAGYDIILSSLPEYPKTYTRSGDTTYYFWEQNRFRFEGGYLYQFRADGSLSKYVQLKSYPAAKDL